MELDRLLAFAEEILALPMEPEIFLERTPHYLAAFEDWERNYESTNSSELPERLETLNQQHQLILNRARELSQQVLDQIGVNNLRAKAIRRYLDRLPSRITIAGKREG